MPTPACGSATAEHLVMKKGWITTGLLLGTILPGQPPSDDLLNQLVNDSPFLPPAGAPRPAASNGSTPFELRGVVFEGGAYAFSVFNAEEGRAQWIRLDEPGLPFIAHHYDPEKETLMLEYQGEALMLPLRESRVQAAEPAPSAPTPLPGPAPGGPRRLPGPATGSPGGPVPSPSPADGAAGGLPIPSNLDPAEAQRMQEMADEIRRRRSLRELPAGPAPAPGGR